MRGSDTLAAPVSTALAGLLAGSGKSLRTERCMATRILLADDHQIVRQGLKSLIQQNEGFEVIAEASDGRAAVQLAADLEPDVIVMDVGMPGLNGIEATRQIAAKEPDAKVVALSMHSDRRFMGEMLKAGAKGYLLKDAAFEELATAIRSVIADKIYLSPRIADVVVDDYVRHAGEYAGHPSAFAKLTPREREVLQLMAEGRATKEIAMDLKVSIKTVETHRRQIMEKLNIYSVAELTKYAIREGLTSLDA
jgi:DNA-binding NarL/FixJ family response regulator